MRKMFRKIVAVALCIAMVSALLPAQQLGLEMAVARAESAPAVTPDVYADVLALAGELLEGGGERSSGDWRYVLIEEKNIAVVTGYDGAAAEELTIPELLGGADVAGIAAGALAGLKGVRRVGVPTNVIAIGKGALPAGSAVKANNGVYAAKWARKNGHAFTSTSEFDFVADVVDLTGTKPENFNRVSAEEIWLRELEASQISVGTKFFLLDPDNMYQISYYQATGLTAMAGGFVAVSCVTPEVDDILYYYEAIDEELMVDYSTLRLAEGAEIDPETEKALEGGVSGELGLKFSPDIDLGDGWELGLSFSQTLSFSGSYEIGLFVDDKATVEQKRKLSGSAELSYSYDDYAVKNEKGEMENPFDEKYKEAVKEFAKRKGEAKKKPLEVDMDMGYAVVFSVAGILNAAVTVKANLELEGKVSISFTISDTTTYTYNNGKLTEEAKKGEKTFEGSAEGTLKVGVTVALELYITAFKVFTVGVFGGIMAEVKWDFGQLLNLLGNFIASNFTEEVVFDELFNLNMMDCVQIDVYFLIEVSATLGVGKLDLASGKRTLVKYKFVMLHWHSLPVDFTVETTEDGKYSYKVDGVKGLFDAIHISTLCPYDVKIAQFHLDEGDGDKIIRRYPNLPIGTKVEKPELDTVKDYGVKLIGWHTDASFDKESLVTEWPYEIKDSVDFYADVRGLRRVNFVDANGTAMTLDCTIKDDENEWTYKDRDGRMAEDEKLVLPDKDAKGKEIKAWILVNSDKDLTPVGNEMKPGDTFKYTGDSEEEIYLCALTEETIMANFYTGVGNNFQVVYGIRGEEITAPQCEGSIPCRKFAGWEANDGTILEAGDKISTDRSTPTILVYTATWEYTGEITAEDLDNIAIGTKPSTSSPTEDEEMYYWKEVEGGVQITGFHVTDELVPVDVRIPETIDGKDVVSISNSAFDNTDSLRSIIFPSTVETVGSSALAGCTSLVFIDLAATQVTSLPNNFADGCTSLLCALLPVGGITAVGNYAFRGCRSFSKANIDYNVGTSAFENCTRLSTVNIGAGCNSIGAAAFKGCTRLTSLIFPDSVTSYGQNVIRGCTALKTLEIQSGVTKIEDHVFDVGENSVLEKLTLGFGISEIVTYSLDNDGYHFPNLTEVVLPSSLKKVGAYAFNGAGIETLTVGFVNGAVTTEAFRGLNKLNTLNIISGSVGKYCFDGLTSLETVNIGEGVTSIGEAAFANCTGLTTVNFAGGAASIGSYVFDGCTALKAVNLAEGLQSIGYRAFRNCSALTSLYIPDSVSSLGARIFEGCTVLAELSVGRVVNTLGSNSDVFEIGESNSLSKLTLREGIVTIPQETFDNDDYGFKSLETVILPSTLRTIERAAFEYCGLKKLVLNGSVTLNAYAFWKCDQLEELVVNAGVINNNAFEQCPSLKKVTLNATSIGNYAFSNCTALTELVIGEGVRTIGEFAFRDCTALTNVDIRYGVRTIGKQAFHNCSALTSISFPDSVISYGNYVIWLCTGLTKLTIGGISTISDATFDVGEGSVLESIVIREGVNTINSGAFDNYDYGYTKLTSVTFPASLQTIYRAFTGSALESVTIKGDVTLKDEAFRGLTNLKSVYMPGGAVGDSAFYDCTALASVYLGDNVTSIGTNAFRNCTSLTGIRLGERVSSIAGQAFYGCTSLKSLTIPDSVTSMSNNALYLCTGLEELSIGAVIDSMGTINVGEGAMLRTLEIRDGATIINGDTFNNNGKYFRNLETLILPATLTTIGSYAFDYSGVQRVVIKGETTIGSYAFRGCNRLEEVSISGGTVGTKAFEGCVSLKTVEIFTGVINEWVFNDCISLETLYLGDGVTKIDHHALRNCRSLKAFNIPDSVTYLGNDILEGCTGIESIVIGGGIGSGLEDGSAYYSPFHVGAPCNLKTLVINEGVTAIPAGTFANYDVEATGYSSAHGFDKLETVIIPESVTYIGENTFGKSGLRSVTINGTTTLESNAFANLTKLEEVTIAGGKLGYGAFDGCTNLETVVLGEGVTGFGEYCFRNCAALKSLYIPDSVTSYGSNMILGCTSLTSLSLGNGVRNVNSGRFDIGEGSNLKVLEVREGVLTLADYSFRNYANNTVYGHPHLETVILPYTLTTLGKGNLENWPKLKHLHLRYGSALPSTDKVSPDLTVYTDYYNYKVDDFALQHNIDYVIRDEMDFPEYTLNFVVPSGTVTNAVMEESDGSLVVTEGTDGQSVILPMGYALLDKQRLQFTDEIVTEEISTVDGYAFYGWYTDIDCNFKWSGAAMPAANLTLYARVEPLVEVRFAVNIGGSPDTNLPAGWNLYESMAVENSEAFPLPEDPAIDGWNFQGWYLDEACTMACTLKKVPAEDLIVYGKMERQRIGGEYRAVSGGLQLTKYTLEQDENPIVYLPAKVNGVPVVSIAKGAFENSGVKGVVIPSTVTEIEPGAMNCSTMVSVSVSAASTSYASDGGVLLDKNWTELVYYPHKKSGTTYYVPSGIEKIGDWAFAGNTTLTRVRFNGNVITEIGESAFSGMTKLTRMDLPESVTTLRLNAFAGCTAMEYFYAYGLETIETKTGMDTLPYGTGMWVYGPVNEGVLRDYYSYTDSDGKVYTNQYNLYRLRLYVTSWENMYIEAGQLLPEMLKDVKLDNGTVVNEWRVDSATGTPVDLATYTMPAAETKLYASYTPLFNGSNTTVTGADGQNYSGYVYTEWNGADGKVVIPATYNGYTSRGIGEGFLAISNKFTEITIPSTVVSIADGALDGFTGTIFCDPDSHAAQWADANGVEWEPILYTLSFVTKGEEIASMQAGKTTLISLPVAERAGFEFNGWHTNEKCTTDVVLDENGLYTMPGADTILYAGWTGTEEVVPFTWTYANKQVTITGYTGTDTSVTIPDTINSWPVVAVAASAFAGKNIAQVNLGQVKTIGNSAFEGCEALRTVTMNAVTEIGDDAFAYCPLLRSPVLPGTLTAIGDSAFEGCCAIGSIDIPNSVKEIGRDAFASCSALKTVSVGAGVKSLNAEMFLGCSMLREITVSDSNAGYRSENGALYTKDGATLILYPAANTAASFTIAAGTVTIGKGAFAGAKNLTNVIFPDSLKEICDNAFVGSGLTAINLAHVETIGDSAFFGCNALETADLGDSVTEIGAMAFGSCGSLTEVTIPVTAQLDDNANVFSSSAILTIIGKTGSSAQTYAKANGIAFRDPDAVAVEKIALSAETLTMNRGDSATLTVTVQPAGAVSDLTWTVNDPAVIMIDQTGLIRAIGGGKAIVTVTADNGVSASCTVIVEAAVEKVIPDIVKPMLVGDTANVGVSFVPASPTNTEVTWTVENEKVATVENGVITAVGLGSTTVTVTAANGVSAKVPVTVYTPVETLTIEAETAEMIPIKGLNTQRLKAVVTPDNATFADCLWSSSDITYVTVTDDGLVTALRAGGTVTITATSKDPSRITATFVVTTASGMDIAEYATVEIIEAKMTEDLNYVLEYVVRAGDEILGSSDYSVSLPTIDGAGDYTMTLSGLGRFTGTLEIPFTVTENSTRITMDSRKFTWIDDLAPVTNVYPAMDYTVEYVLIAEDGSRTSVGAAPTITGLYEIIARTERYETESGSVFEAAEESVIMWIQTEGGLKVYDSITLVKGQKGRIPVLMQSEYAPLQSGYVYKSSDNSVFTVDSNGRITAVGNGTATLSITGGDDKRFTGSCEITVSDLMTMNLPAALKAIEAEAFAGLPAVQQLIVGDKVTSIDSRAFADMSSLEQVILGSGSMTISADAFENSDPLIICKAGSVAARFADACGLKRFTY